MKSSVPSVNKRVKEKFDKSISIISYDIDNKYPQRILDIIRASGTATRSVELYASFIMGGGFKDQKFYKSVVNSKGLTADKLLRASVNDLAHYGGKIGRAHV
jgi:hypothetical protein